MICTLNLHKQLILIHQFIQRSIQGSKHKNKKYRTTKLPTRNEKMTKKCNDKVERKLKISNTKQIGFQFSFKLGSKTHL